MDYFSLKAAVAEARERFAGRKVHDARQISPFEMVLEFHSEAALVLSINPPRPGLFILDRDTSLPDIGTPFSDLLRARINGTTMKSLRLPEPGERVVNLDLATGWPAREGEPLMIILEVMGRHSNLVVVQGEKILQPLKTVSSGKSRLRPVLPGERWTPPPSRPGSALDEITPEDLPVPSAPTAALELMQSVRGLSPYTARQAVMRAVEGGRNGLHKALTAMSLSADGAKGYLHRAGHKIHLTPFEPMIITGKETCEQFTPFSAASSVWWEEGRQIHAAEGNEKDHLISGLKRMEDKLRSTLESLDRELERCQTHEKVRLMAETLLIHASDARRGSDSVTLPNPYEPEKELTIPLDPSLPTAENADLMFAEAHRLKRGVKETSDHRKKIERELSTVSSALQQLIQEGDPSQAKVLLGSEAGVRSHREQGTFRAYPGPGKKYTADGFTILVGRSAQDNEKVTFQAAGPHDLWLHVRDYPGSHVVILTEKKKVPDAILYRAAELAAESSGARNEKAPEIMVTERKWVRKIKGGKPGKVTVERYRTVRPKKK
jgi:predicted ribosome quality control (RQC) complex YloA/Tae2 family protein